MGQGIPWLHDSRTVGGGVIGYLDPVVVGAEELADEPLVCGSSWGSPVPGGVFAPVSVAVLVHRPGGC